ncbi:TDP-N-acetylfucosamine:lipid II N-acetylfucosaminyltransferase [Chitinophaga sp. Hz27]|uniref:TDP-N-acetylfucosamine:lipid II N-acetylfucosaminyltransferase n=1 Tax=Chitinophaga sp. Hz27 TaxID=3347169 RepID=UPI0035D6A7B1
MKYVHVIVNTAYTAPFITLINQNFDSSEHVFFVIRGWSEDKVKIPVQDNVYPINKLGNLKYGFRLIRNLNSSKKIFIHGLFGPLLLLLLRLQPWLLRKSSWAVWGGDLYGYQYPKISLKDKFEERLRRFCIKRFSELITIKGDYDLAKKWYNATGAYKHAMYSTPLKTEEIDNVAATVQQEKRDVLHIQIGNSAAPENNHFEMLELLKPYQQENIKIFALLSYGVVDQYADDVIAQGKAYFGDKFVAIRDYMNFNDFISFMNQMDIVIFNHRRQQAIGNLFLATYLKKKIFFNQESTLWYTFTEEYKINLLQTSSIQTLDFQTFSSLNDNIAAQNKQMVSAVLKEEHIINLWAALFNK